MMQNALQKERREMKQAQREAQMDSIPAGLNNHWIDPMPDGRSRFIELGNVHHVIVCIIMPSVSFFLCGTIITIFRQFVLTVNNRTPSSRDTLTSY